MPHSGDYPRVHQELFNPAMGTVASSQTNHFVLISTGIEIVWDVSCHPLGWLIVPYFKSSVGFPPTIPLPIYVAIVLQSSTAASYNNPLADRWLKGSMPIFTTCAGTVELPLHPIPAAQNETCDCHNVD